MKGIEKRRKINAMGAYNEIEKNKSQFEKEYYEEGWGKLYDSYDAFIEELLSEIRQSQEIPTMIHYYNYYYGTYIYKLEFQEIQEWWYKGFAYSVDTKTLDRFLYTTEQISLLIMEDYDKERKRFERLKRKFELSENEKAEIGRPSIPERVRIEVWRRDEGKCVKCGSRERLEYDHIIPVSKGGSNTARNIELLCEQCNRKKGSQIK